MTGSLDPRVSVTLRLPINDGCAVADVPVSAPNLLDGAQARGHVRRNEAIATAVMSDAVSAPDLPFGRVVRSDALAFVQSLPDRSVSLVLSSPPYLWKRTYGDDPAEVGRELTVTAYLGWTRRLFAEFARVLRPDGWVYWNVGDTYATVPSGYRGDPGKADTISVTARDAAKGSSRVREFDVPGKSLSLVPWRLLCALVVEDRWICRNVIAWHKPNHQPENVFDRQAQAWEPILMMTRSQHPWYERTPAETGLDRDDHWSILAGRRGAGAGHPAVFPADLARRAIAHACPPGGVVLDPFAGSGTVIDMAAELGRRALGCDLYEWRKE